MRMLDKGKQAIVDSFPLQPQPQQIWVPKRFYMLQLSSIWEDTGEASTSLSKALLLKE